MLSAHAIPLLLSILVGLLLGLLVWGFWRTWRREVGGALLETRDDLLLGLLMLAAFALGIFLTYVLLGFYP